MSARQASAWDTVTHALAKATGSGGRNGQWICPAHDDRNPSLSVGLGDDRQTVVMRCHAGCQLDDVLSALDLTVRDLFEKPEKSNGNGTRKPRIVATYPYTDEAGDLLYEVVRFDPKSFRQRRPDGRGGWIWKLGDVRRVLYRLPAVVDAVRAGEVVWITEGEKDADALTRAGEVATCAPQGAGKWTRVPDAAEVLRDATVIVWADDDPPGHDHARQVARSIDGTAAGWLIVRSPYAKDAAGHLGQGRPLSDLEELASSDGDRRWLDGAQPESDTSASEGERTPTGQLPRYRSTCLADVKPERVRWLWSGRLPAGKLVTLDGPPGVGKSTLIVDVMARLTRGEALPGEELALVPASSVVVMSAEDGLSDTIRPRLDAAGADVSRVHHLDGIPVYDDDGKQLSERPPVIPDDIDAMEALIAETGAVLVVVDVLMAYLSGRTNAHRDQDVRSALARLSAVADRTGACIVVLRHLRKAGGDAITAGGGSIGIIGAARAGLVVALDPDDETETRRICAVAKSNLAAKPPALAYVLTTVEDNGAARVEWRGATAHTADQLVAPRDNTGERSKVDRAEEWLRDALEDGPVPWRQLKADAEAADLDRNALHRARERMGDEVRIDRDEATRGRPSTWRLVSSHGPMRRNPETKPENAVTRENAPETGVTSQSLSPETKPEPGTRPCRDCEAPTRDVSGLCAGCMERRRAER